LQTVTYMKPFTKTGKTFCDLLVIRVLEMIGDIFPDALSGGYAVPPRILGIIRNRARLFTAPVLKSMTERE